MHTDTAGTPTRTWHPTHRWLLQPREAGGQYPHQQTLVRHASHVRGLVTIRDTACTPLGRVLTTPPVTTDGVTTTEAVIEDRFKLFPEAVQPGSTVSTRLALQQKEIKTPSSPFHGYSRPCCH